MQRAKKSAHLINDYEIQWKGSTWTVQASVNQKTGKISIFSLFEVTQGEAGRDINTFAGMDSDAEVVEGKEAPSTTALAGLPAAEKEELLKLIREAIKKRLGR